MSYCHPRIGVSNLLTKTFAGQAVRESCCSRILVIAAVYSSHPCRVSEEKVAARSNPPTAMYWLLRAGMRPLYRARYDDLSKERVLSVALLARVVFNMEQNTIPGWGTSSGLVQMLSCSGTGEKPRGPWTRFTTFNGLRHHCPVGLKVTWMWVERSGSLGERMEGEYRGHGLGICERSLREGTQYGTTPVRELGRQHGGARCGGARTSIVRPRLREIRRPDGPHL